MNRSHELAYIIDPALWVHQVLGVEPAGWQEQFLRAERGASIIVLTSRQAGKTTTAAWAIAHFMLYNPASLNVIGCPAREQSAEAVRHVKEALLKANAQLVTDNVYGLELENGARVRALPGSDDSVRGLTVDGWIVVDEAARISEDFIPALGPMRARKPDARFALLSTAWSRTDPFWTIWSNEDPSWLRIMATADGGARELYSEKFLAQQLRTFGEAAFKREYLGVPNGSHTSPFIWELYDRATPVCTPQPGGPVFNGRPYSAGDVESWPLYKPIIAHDVGRSRDRSTAVVGGNNPYRPRELGIVEAHELPQNLFGSARARALKAIDQQYNDSSLIIADLSNDATYGEILVQDLGRRVIGVQISRHGDGMEFEARYTHHGPLLVYTVGRTYLLELLHREFESDLVRLGRGADVRRGYEQLANLDVDYRQGGTVYQCAPGHHDDLGISFAILAWAAQHPHLCAWMRNVGATRQLRAGRPRIGPAGWT